MGAVFVVSLFSALRATVVVLEVVAGGLLATAAARKAQDRFKGARRGQEQHRWHYRSCSSVSTPMVLSAQKAVDPLPLAL